MRVSRKKVWIGLGVVALAGAVVFANFYFKREQGKEVATEALKKRDLEAVVSASGKIQAKRFVNISADTVGRITDLAVDEGVVVRKGQFLLQIDPRNLESAFRRGQAGLAATEAQLDTLRTGIETARANLQLAQDNLKRQRDLWAEQ
jgi:multidrug efflux pump subunit AcrA (membrane-fusion protein)